MSYQVLPWTTRETFETIGDWTAGGTGGGALAVDSSIFTVGTGSLKITCPASGNYYGTKTVSYDLSGTQEVSFDVYVANITDTTGITVYLSNDSGFTNYLSIGITNLVLGWQRIVVNKAWWTVTGTGTFASSIIRVRVRQDCAASGIGIVYFDNLRTGGYTRPKVVLIMDDGFSTQYTLAYAYMKPLGLRATIGVISSAVGTGGYMSLTQLQELFAAGWDMVNHTVNHTNLTTFGTAQQMIDEVDPCSTYLITNGLARNGGEKLFLYPNGGYNQAAIDVLTGLNFKAARTIRSQTNLMTASPPAAYLNLVTRDLNNTKTLASAKLDIDHAIATGGTIIFESHKFVPSPSVATEFLDTDLTALIDYIYVRVAGGQMDMVTFPEWYKGLTESRKLA